MVFESTHLRKDGTAAPVELNAKIIETAGTKLIFSVIRDISGCRTTQQKIAQLAHFDVLTELSNRNFFFDRLDQVVARAKRYQQKFALLLLDLERFTRLNDEFEHPIGDSLLGIVTERLTGSARDMDTVAPVGGDKFIVLLANVDNPDNAILVADRILETLSHPFAVNGNGCVMGYGIVIAMFPDDSEEAGTLVKMADDGMYMAKKGWEDPLSAFQTAAG